MSVKTLHAVAYVDRFAQDANDAWEPVIWGQLPVPAKQTEGEFLDAILGQVDNFTCDGDGKATKGCTETHAAARERVRMRAMPNGKLAVVWRRYHPLIHQDQADVGAPLEAKDEENGTRIRIEVREIDYDGQGVRTDAAISEDEVATLEAELTQMQQAAAQKVAADEQIRAFLEGTVGPAGDTVEQAEQDFQDLPKGGGVGDLKERLGAIAGFLGTALQISFGGQDEGGEEGLMKAWRAGCAGGALTFDVALATAQQEVAAILAAVQTTRQQQAALIEFQGQVRTLVEKVEDYTGRRSEVIALQDDGPEPPDLAPLKKELGAIQTTAQKTAVDALPDLQAKLADWSGRAQPVFTQLEAAFAETEALREALTGRIDAVEQYRDQSKLTDWHRIIEQGQGYPGFGVAHFKTQAETAMAALAKNIGDTDKALDLENPQLKSELSRLEALIEKDESAFFADVLDAMAPCSKSVFREVDAGGVRFQLPFASVRIGEGDDIVVEARNQHEHAMSLDFVDAAGQATRLNLRNKGEVVTKTVAGAAPFSFRVVAVAAATPDGQPDAAGQAVNVESRPIQVARAGSHQFAAPRGYRVRPSVANAVNVPLADDPQATYREERIPGVEGASK